MKKGQKKHWRSGPPSQSPGGAELRRMYVEERLSYADIARRFCVTKTTIKRWFKAAGISARTISEGTSIAQTGRALSEEHKEALRKSLAYARSQRTEASHRKQAEAMRGRTPPNKGGTWSPETRAKHAVYRQTPEYRLRLSESNKRAKPRNTEISELEERLRGWRWRELRRQVYERDKWTCQECGVHCQNKIQSRTKATIRIQCHHIVPRRDGGVDDLDNLVTLCMSCHMKREWLERRKC